MAELSLFEAAEKIEQLYIEILFGGVDESSHDGIGGTAEGHGEADLMACIAINTLHNAAYQMKIAAMKAKVTT